MQLCPECLYFGVSGFSRCISRPGYKEIDNFIRVLVGKANRAKIATLATIATIAKIANHLKRPAMGAGRRLGNRQRRDIRPQLHQRPLTVRCTSSTAYTIFSTGVSRPSVPCCAWAPRLCDGRPKQAGPSAGRLPLSVELDR